MSCEERVNHDVRAARQVLGGWCIGRGLDPDAVLSDLERLYAIPRRQYHTFQGHVLPSFPKIDDLSVGKSDELAIAWLFHDAVYDPKRNDNEELSAKAMWNAFHGPLAWVVREIEGDDERAGEMERLFVYSPAVVERLILATKHDRAPETLNERLIIDCDLAILGAPREEFVAYERGIRQEYAFVSDLLFRKKRAEILEEFLARPSIYTSGHFNALEERARENLRWSIDRLRSQQSLLEA